MNPVTENMAINNYGGTPKKRRNGSEKSFNRLLKITAETVLLDKNSPIFEEMAKHILIKVKKNVKEMFVESRANPYKYSGLTYQIGHIKEKVYGLEAQSSKIQIIREGFGKLYENMLKIRCVSTSILCCAFPKEIEEFIVSLMFEEKFEAVRAKALYYAYTEEEISRKFTSTSQSEQLAPDFENQAITNRQKYMSALESAISHNEYEEYSIELKEISPEKFTFFHDCMKALCQRQSDPISRFTNLNSIKTSTLKILTQVKHPEKITKINICADPCDPFPDGVSKYFQSYVNVEEMSGLRYLQFLPRFKKLKKISDVFNYSRDWTSQAFPKCSSLESIEVFNDGINLLLLPEPTKLKRLYLIVRATPEVHALSGFSNLEYLYLNLNIGGEFNEIINRVLEVNESLRVLKIKCQSFYNNFNDIMTASCIVRPNIKSFHLEGSIEIDEEGFRSIVSKFPNLQCMRGIDVGVEFQSIFKEKGITINK